MVEKATHGFPPIVSHNSLDFRPPNPLLKPQPPSLKKLYLRRLPLTLPQSQPHQRVRLLHQLPHHRYCHANSKLTWKVVASVVWHLGGYGTGHQFGRILRSVLGNLGGQLPETSWIAERVSIWNCDQDEVLKELDWVYADVYRKHLWDTLAGDRTV